MDRSVMSQDANAMRPVRLGAAFLFILVFIFAAFFSPPAFNQGSATSASVWVADHQTIYGIDPATNSVVVTIPQPYEVDALAVDPSDRGVWVLAHKRLLKFDVNTSLTLELDLKSLSKKVEDGKRLLLNPYDRSLWVITEKAVLHLDHQGRLVHEWQAPGEIRAATLAQDESLWVVSGHDLLKIGATGTVLLGRSLKGILDEPKLLQTDALGGNIWVADKKRLIRLSTNDLSADPAIVFEAKEAGSRDDEGNKPEALVLDPLTGQVWLVTKRLLRSYDRAGNEQVSVPLPEGMKEVEVAIFGYDTQSLWVGSKKVLYRIPRAGASSIAIPVGKELEAVASASVQLFPAITLLEPAINALTSNPKPTIRIQLAAWCNSQPGCNVGTGYLESLVLDVKLNGTSIGDKFIIANGQASYAPPERLPEGPNALSIRATDKLGHSSNTILGTFTIDTIAPVFQDVTPADGTVVTAAEITVAGSVDDATATVTIENLTTLGGRVLDQNPKSFSFSVPLAIGQNTINLKAVDPAGNVARKTLKITRIVADTVEVTVNPVANVNGKWALIEGTYKGPQNTGIVVNGVVADVYDGRFFANNVPVNPGNNSLEVVASTLAGQPGTKTISASASGAGSIKVTPFVPGTSEVATLAGNGTSGFGGDGGPATNTVFANPSGIAVGSDGSVYISDNNNNRIRRIGSDGIITTVAGDGQYGYSGDGILATQVRLAAPRGIALGSDGTLYITDPGNYRVRKVSPNGIISTVAGNGQYGTSGDGGPATVARLLSPSVLAVGPDGSLYIADSDANRVRRVDSNGIITTVAGNGQYEFTGDGGPATSAALAYPYGLAVQPDGSLIIADSDNLRIRRVAPDGKIETIAGNGEYGNSGDGGPAKQAAIGWVLSLTATPDGTIYFSDDLGYIRKITKDGTITTVAGTGATGFNGDGKSPLETQFKNPQGLALTSTHLVISDTQNHRIRRFELNKPAKVFGNRTWGFQVENSTGNTLKKTEVDFNGDGVVDTTTENPGELLYYTYPGPGVYYAKFTATDQQGATYSTTYVLVIYDPAERDRLFGDLWNSMNAALVGGDHDRALLHLNAAARAKYGPVFTALRPHFAEIVASYSPLRQVAFSHDIGEYAVTRMAEGQKRLYLIYFLKDGDGVWRLDAM